MNVYKYICILLFLMVGEAHSVNKHGLNLEGVLYYGGQGLYKLDLETGRNKSVYDMPDSLVENISKIDSNRILLNIRSLKKPSSPKKIAVFNRESRHLTILRNGSSPVYIPSHRKIVFYEGRDLSIMDIDSPGESKKIIDSVSTPILEPVIQVSDDEIVFENKSDGVYVISQYNIITESVENLSGFDNCSLHNSFWWSSGGKLYCVERKSESSARKAYLIGLDGSGKTSVPIDIDHGWWPVSYLGELNYLIVQERVSSFLGLHEKHPVWLYDFNSGKKEKVAEDVLLGSSSAFFKSHSSKD